MAVFAHQDDVEFCAFHGIVECYDNADKGFHAVIVCDGTNSSRAGKYANYTNEQMITSRAIEQETASKIGRYTSLDQFKYPSAEIMDKNNSNVVQDIYNALVKVKPEVVYTHNLADKHNTHVAVVLRLISAIRMMLPQDRPQVVYGCEMWRGLDWLCESDKVVLDVSKNRELAWELFNVFESQIAGGKNYAKGVCGRCVANAAFDKSHALDTLSHVTYAMDLTPLIKNDKLCPAEFTKDYINRFECDVLTKINAFV